MLDVAVCCDNKDCAEYGQDVDIEVDAEFDCGIAQFTYTCPTCLTTKDCEEEESDGSYYDGSERESSDWEVDYWSHMAVGGD
jgi:hypothetical protein